MSTNEKKITKKVATNKSTTLKTASKNAPKKSAGQLAIKFNVKDEYYTPRILVEPILDYIPKGSTIWCPFDTKNSEFVLVLRENGYKVIHSHIWENKDFLTYEPEEHYDYIISNPPFSIKIDVFKRLFSLNKPFAVLMSSNAEQYQGIGTLFYQMAQEGKYIQKLNPDKRVSFDGNRPSFSTAYFCWNILPREYVMCHLEHDNSGKRYVPSRMWQDANKSDENVDNVA